MSYNNRLQANNAELQEILDMANSLPDAGEGGQATPTQEKSIDIATNGSYEVTPDEGYALSKVTANVNIAIQTETKTVTPSASQQDVTPSDGKYLSKVTVNGDENLKAENIKNGVSIFGVTGTHEGGGDSVYTFTVVNNSSYDIRFFFVDETGSWTPASIGEDQTVSMRTTGAVVTTTDCVVQGLVQFSSNIHFANPGDLAMISISSDIKTEVTAIANNPYE